MAKRIKKVPQRSPIDIIIDRLLAVLNNPTSFIVLIFSIFILYSVSSSPSSNVITQFADKLAEIAALKPLATWIKSNVIKLAGFIQFWPVAATRRNNTWLYLAVFYALCIYTPQIEIWEYPIQALTFYLFLSTNDKTVKVILVATVLVLYYLGFGFSNILGKPKTQTP